MSKTIMTKQKFKNQWLRHFAPAVDKKDIEKYVADCGGYVWHVFSFELIDKTLFLVGDVAREAYDLADKTNCIFCDMFGPSGVTNKVVAEYSSAMSIDSSVTELYVVSEDFSWTYIKTHENGLCGPYFMKIK